MEQYVLSVEQCRELVQLGLDMNNAKLCWDNGVDCIKKDIEIHESSLCIE